MTRKQANYKGSSYMKSFLEVETLKPIVENVVEKLKKKKFDTIAYRGQSGALIAPIVALRMGKGLILVRKDEDSTHSLYKTEGAIAKRYVIIDDFIASGRTAQAIVKGVAEHTKHKAELVGMIECVRGYKGNVRFISGKKIHAQDYL